MKKQVVVKSINCAVPMYGLFFVLLILKLTGCVTWSWWYITLPLTISLAFGMLVLFMSLVVIALLAVFCIIAELCK